MNSISSPTVRPSAKKRALSQPSTCPVCCEQLSPPVRHACGELGLSDRSHQDQHIEADLSAIAEFLSAGGTLPPVDRYFGQQHEVA